MPPSPVFITVLAQCNGPSKLIAIEIVRCLHQFLYMLLVLNRFLLAISHACSRLVQTCMCP